MTCFFGIRYYNCIKMPGKSIQRILSTNGYVSRYACCIRGCFLFVFIIAFAALAADTPQAGTAEVNLNQLYQDGMNAFQIGDFQKAITNLESVVAQAAPDAKLEAVFYTLGAAYFNLQQYPKAIELFKKYIEKYPKSNRLDEAVYSLGRASLFIKDYNGALGYFKQLEANPKMRGEAIFQEAMTCRFAGRDDDAIAAFERIVGGGITTQRSASCAIILAELYARKHDSTKALGTLRNLQEKISLVDNVVRLNSLAVELGDALLEDQKTDSALLCFHMVRTHDEIVKFQTDRIAAMQNRIDRNIEMMRAGSDALDTAVLLSSNNQIRDAITEEKKLLEDFKKLPDIQPALLLRIARCYYDSGRKWESIIVYDTLLRKYPDTPEREQALYGLIIASTETGRVKKSLEYCEQYLKEFPRGLCANTVGYLEGATALQADNPVTAETYFGRMLREQPNNTYREEMQFLLGHSLFAQGKYEEASRIYDKSLHDYPNGQHVEEATYRKGLCAVFLGNYEDAMRLVSGYIAKYPQGAFISDAKYRLAVCHLAAQDFDKVREICDAWQKQYPGNPQLAEVLALEGDMFVAIDQNETAIDLYLHSYKSAQTDQVLNYSLFEAVKLLQKLGQWDQISSVLREFVEKNPDHPTVVSAMYWIGRAMVHQGKAEEARQFISKTVNHYIADPNSESVEMLLTQMAQLCIRKKTTTVSETDSASSTGPAPDAELDTLLGRGENLKTPIAMARLLFAKSELARMRKQFSEQENFLQQIADGFKPGELSSTLLAQTGDYLLGKGEIDKAAAFYQELMDNYPKSQVLDYAYNGLGEIAYRKQQYEKALKLFNDAVDKAGASIKLKDVTVGKAKTLLALGRLDDSKKAFEEVVSVREWRGDVTAYSVFSLGEIAQKQNRISDAIASYQQVYVAYRRFLPWVAKAYINAGECLEKQGKIQDAANAYHELLHNEKLAGFPETEIARKHLKEAGME